MTIAEKLNMYRDKKKFMDGLNSLFKDNPKGLTVTNMSYEVYQIDINCEPKFYEWLVMEFEGGTKMARSISGNSNLGNFRAVGDMIYGGYYDEMPNYEDLEKDGYELVVL